MKDTHFVFGLLTLLFVASGLLVLRVQTSREEARAVGRLLPVAVLFQYPWFKYVAALSLFFLGAVSGWELLSQL